MVEGGIQVVRPDGVDPKLLHQRGVPQTCCAVAQRVADASPVASLSTWLVVDAYDEVAVACCGVDEFLPLDFDGVECIGGKCEGIE